MQQDSEKNMTDPNPKDEEHLHGVDEGYQLYTQGLAAQSARTPEEQALWEKRSKRIARKFDHRLLAMMCFVVGINYIDKAAIAWAVLFDFRQDLNLSGNEYSWISSVFYFGYLAGQIPTTYLTARISHAKVIGFTCIAWGVLMLGTVGVKNYGQMMAIRFLLGMFEAPITPALVSYTAAFYTRKENTARTCIWGSMQGAFYLVFTLVAYGSGHIKSNALRQWAWIFLIIGLLSVILGAGWILFMPDSPMKAQFLDEEEKVMAVERVAENMTGTQGQEIKLYQIVDALKDPIYWLTVIYTIVGHVTNGISSFNSLVVKSFGFNQFNTLLVGLPSSIVSAGSLIIWSFITRKWGTLRTIGMSVPLIPSIIGLATVYATSEGNYNKWGRAFAFWLINSYAVCWPFLQAFIGVNFAGHTKRAFVYASVLVAYSVGNIIGPFIFPSSIEANYGAALAILMVFSIVTFAFAFVIRFTMMWDNRRRDRLYGTVDREQRTEGAVTSLLDKTDRENKAFRYVL